MYHTILEVSVQLPYNVCMVLPKPQSSIEVAGPPSAALSRPKTYIHADRYTRVIIALRTLQAVGDQFGTLVETVVSIGVAVLISFVVNWLLTLVIVVFVPIMVGAGLLQLLVLALHATHYKKSTEEALKVYAYKLSHTSCTTEIGSWVPGHH